MPRCLGACALTALCLLLAGGIIPGAASAQAPKAAGVFDDDDVKEKPSTAAAKKPTVTDRDTIGFTQENAAAQMTELEERMFRLSEALRGLEPENASRLRLALKFSREEQILDQMRETHKFLKDAQISKAETEVRELIAKLEHLRNLLLAEDLDFQLKLARLRQLRETTGQLDRVIKEERRGLGWSRFVIDQRKHLDRFTARRPDLQALVRDQEGVIEDAKKVLELKEDADAGSLKPVQQRAVRLRNAVSALATDPLFADLQPPHLRKADVHLAEVVEALEGSDAKAVVGPGEKALGLLRDELVRLDEEIGQTEKTISEGAFRVRADDQAKNRGTTDRLAESSARLGDAGVALRKDLIRASVSMRTAEDRLRQTSAAPAADEQTAAVDVLARSREELRRAVEKLLVELRVELQARMVADLTEMHELQSSIREATQAQAPKVAQKSRTALIVVAGLSKKEAELGERTEHLLALAEETEFGIALPTTLRVFSREMRSIEGWLKAGDVAPRTTELEARIEDDLLSLLQAVRRLPPTTPPVPGTPLSTEPRERERELNRLVAELKMVRMLQYRLNDDTVGVDKARPPVSTLSPALRREVEALESTQDEIRDSLAKIAEKLVFPETNQ
jgi:hypothetical protein